MGEPDIDHIVEAGLTAYGNYNRYEVARFKVLRHCNLMPRLSQYSPPQTRQQGANYTVLITSSCAVCPNRHTSLGHKAYLLHYGALPFKCEHGNRLTNLAVDDPDSRTLPFVNLPSQIFRLEPDCASEASSHGEITVDKLDRDKQRLQNAFTQAENSFHILSATVRNTNVNIAMYPQYDPDYLNHLIALMETHADECIGFIEAHKTNLLRLSEVSEDVIRISESGELTTVDAEVHTSPNLGVGFGNTEPLPQTGLTERIEIPSCITSPASTPVTTAVTTSLLGSQGQQSRSSADTVIDTVQ